MTKAWVCPACGEQNALDAPECTVCGRWASIFDLERTVDVVEPGDLIDEDEWEPATVRTEVHARAGEPTGLPELDAEVIEDEAVDEPMPDQPGRRLLRWLLPLIAIGWIVIRLIAEQF